MNILSKTLALFTALLTLTGCNGQGSVIEIKKNKIGGLYATSENGMEYEFYNSDQTFQLDTLTFIPFSDFNKLQRDKSQYDGVYSLGFSLNETGTQKFKEMTEKNMRKQVCFVVGDKVMAAPIIQTTILNGIGSIMISDKEAVEKMIEYLEN